MVPVKREINHDPVLQRIIKTTKERAITEKELSLKLGMSRGTFTN